MPLKIKRIYEEPQAGDGRRILVDRLWPRGISKDRAQIDDWLKEFAPSDSLRKSYHDGALAWGEFRRQYLSELKSQRDELRRFATSSKNRQVTLLFSARDEKRNNAVVLRQYLERLRI